MITDFFIHSNVVTLSITDQELPKNVKFTSKILISTQSEKYDEKLALVLDTFNPTIIIDKDSSKLADTILEKMPGNSTLFTYGIN